MEYTVEPVWNAIYHSVGGNHFVLQTILPFLTTQVVFWGVGLLFLYTDLTEKPSWIAKHKIQEDKNVPVCRKKMKQFMTSQLQLDRQKLKHTLKTVIFNIVVVSFPFSFAIYPLQERAGCSTSLQLPSLFVILRDLLAYVIIEEIGFYYSHRLVHYGPLYRKIHKKHHEWIAPIAIVAIYCHPVEMVVSNLIPIVAGPIIMGSHVVTNCIWLILAMATTLCHHSGYHLPLMPSPQFHDYHHLKFNTNYGVTGFLDWVHGTDKQFAHKVQKRRHRLLMPGSNMKQLEPDAGPNRRQGD